ncbi:MAG: uncharacterized protein QOK42_1321 [Frankiaceae bacterium]|jgi:hypothetical protein|nr:uncharacterized protein [Frankiaceae bacterium]MDX6273720.1 uncharacterized protein [Frankiales bacterium]
MASPLPDLGPRLDPTHLAVSRFPRGWRPATWPEGFASVVEDDDEVTLVCAESAVAEVSGDTAPLESEHGWRRVTFAGPLPWEVVGFLADVAGRLAAARIPFASVAAFTTDHVLVRAAQADLAVSVLAGEPAPEPRPGVEA